jgi:hypothetical protein
MEVVSLASVSINYSKNGNRCISLLFIKQPTPEAALISRFFLIDANNIAFLSVLAIL